MKFIKHIFIISAVFLGGCASDNPVPVSEETAKPVAQTAPDAEQASLHQEDQELPERIGNVEVPKPINDSVNFDLVTGDSNAKLDAVKATGVNIALGMPVTIEILAESSIVSSMEIADIVEREFIRRGFRVVGKGMAPSLPVSGVSSPQYDPATTSLLELLDKQKKSGSLDDETYEKQRVAILANVKPIAKKKMAGGSGGSKLLFRLIDASEYDAGLSLDLSANSKVAAFLSRHPDVQAQFKSRRVISCSNIHGLKLKAKLLDAGTGEILWFGTFKGIPSGIKVGSGSIEYTKKVSNVEEVRDAVNRKMEEESSILPFLGSKKVVIPAWKFIASLSGPSLNPDSCQKLSDEGKSEVLEAATSMMIASILPR